MEAWVQIFIAVVTIIASVACTLVAVSFKFGSKFSEIDARIAANALAISNLNTALDKSALDHARQYEATAQRLDRKDTRISALEQVGPEIRATLANLDRQYTTMSATIDKLAERMRGKGELSIDQITRLAPLVLALLPYVLKQRQGFAT